VPSPAITAVMEGFAAGKDICSFTEVRQMSERSDVAGLVQVGTQVGAIVALGVVVWAVGDRWWLMIPAQMAMGVLITFLFCGVHETTHWTPFRTKGLNDAVGTVLGFIVFLPFRWFRHFHFEHHRETHIEGGDPELGEAKPTGKLEFLFYLTGLKSFWLPALRTLLRHAMGRIDDGFIPDGTERRLCIRQARLHLLGYGLITLAAIVFRSWAPLTYWIVPMVLSAWTLRLYLLAEHTLLPHVPDMLENTRTMKTNALVRWFAWQMPYHVEHHVFPAIPFHRLHEACDRIAPRHRHLIPGYWHFFKEYWASCQWASGR